MNDTCFAILFTVICTRSFYFETKKYLKEALNSHVSAQDT